MTATFVLQRNEDPSGVSGVGEVAVGIEFDDGSVALRWPGEHPSTAVWEDIRHMEAIHGHAGKTVVTYTSSERLLAAYKRIVPHLLSDLRIPVTCAPHPDHPDRLRLTFKSEALWRFWTALLDGSTDAASHVEVNGEMEHTWIDPSGSIWLQCWTPLADEDPLTMFEREDR